jgi:transglutaminase-like putative cysteine protease
MHVRHHYRYEYSAPVHDVRQKLVMVPPDRHGDQMLTSFDLDVRGTSGRLLVNWDTDRFGNRLCLVEAERVEEALDFEAWFTVHRRASAHWLDLDPDTREVLTRFTPLTLPDWRIRAAATRIAQETQLAGDRVHRAHEWTASSIRYQPGVTGTQTPAAMALYLGQGVCQDYAHIMLSLLRALGIACRYVSGHLLGDGAPHAWVEALLVDSAARLEVVACDPTHSRAAGSDYIVVATGRDFSDVTSTSGVFTGAAVGKLHWSKQASGAPEAVDSAA